MKKTDLVRNDLRWLGRVLGFTKGGNVRVRWETGPLKGREGLVPKTTIRRAH